MNLLDASSRNLISQTLSNELVSECLLGKLATRSRRRASGLNKWMVGLSFNQIFQNLQISGFPFALPDAPLGSCVYAAAAKTPEELQPIPVFSCASVRTE